jgi:hypothetical protein
MILIIDFGFAHNHNLGSPPPATFASGMATLCPDGTRAHNGAMDGVIVLLWPGSK